MSNSMCVTLTPDNTIMVGGHGNMQMFKIEHNAITKAVSKIQLGMQCVN